MNREEDHFDEKEVYITPRDVADIFGVPTQTVYRWIKDGVIREFVRAYNNRYIIKKSIVDDMLSEGDHMFSSYMDKSEYPIALRNYHRIEEK